MLFLAVAWALAGVDGVKEAAAIALVTAGGCSRRKRLLKSQAVARRLDIECEYESR